jgi:3-deoxy-D-manno-octulosonic-acid transferase
MLAADHERLSILEGWHGVRFLYNLIAYVAAPVAFLAVLWRGARDPAYRGGYGERFGFGDAVAGEGCIWVHAVSLGEVAAASSLMRSLRDAYPDRPIVLTTATPTGFVRARELFSSIGVIVRFGPYDLPGSVRRFFSGVKPKLAIFMETELWPNMYRECDRRSVPKIIASARISTRSLPRYRRLRAWLRPLLQGDLIVAAQTADDADRFRLLGAPDRNVTVAGNLKFDIQIDPNVLTRGAELRTQYLRSRTAWTAGSTHAGEEEQLLDAHALVRAAVPDALLVLVPRHPNRFDSVAALLTRRAIRFVRRSEGTSVNGDIEVVLVDTLGELLSFYAATNAAFVGGSLVPVGGHNLLEPAALGLPVATGPFTNNGPEVAKLLLQRNAAVCVDDAQQLAAALSGWLGEPSEGVRTGAIARGVVAANRGALQRIMAMVQSKLAPAKPA